MSIKVKGFLQDVGGASRVTRLREENFAKGSTIIDPRDPIRELADKLHPEHMTFKVVDIREATKDEITATLKMLTGEGGCGCGCEECGGCDDHHHHDDHCGCGHCH